MRQRVVNPWGWSQEVYRDQFSRVVRIGVNQGCKLPWMFCECLDKQIFVLAGDLFIDRKNGDINSESNWLDYESGNNTQVFSGEIHRLVNASKTEVAEVMVVYTPEQSSDSDGVMPVESDEFHFDVD